MVPEVTAEVGNQAPWTNLLREAAGAEAFTLPHIDIEQTPRRVVELRRAQPADYESLVTRLSAHPELSFSPQWEAEKLARSIAEGSSPVLVATVGGQVVGMAVGGVHGVRGVLHYLLVEPGSRDMGIGRQLAEGMLNEFANAGVYRVHVFVNDDNRDARAYLDRLGFAPQIGERFMQRDLISPEDPALNPLPVPEGVTFRDASVADIDRLIARIAGVKELAFQEWETALLRSWAERPCGQICRIAYDENDHILGAIIGGHNGIRGTINHTWVAEGCRKHGLGGFMATEVIREFAAEGVKRIHLMVTPGNDVAYRFWDKHHFQEIPGETFLEVDIPCPTR